MEKHVRLGSPTLNGPPVFLTALFSFKFTPLLGSRLSRKFRYSSAPISYIFDLGFDTGILGSDFILICDSVTLRLFFILAYLFISLSYVLTESFIWVLGSLAVNTGRRSPLDLLTSMILP
jgi:hypothetical protein